MSKLSVTEALKLVDVSKTTLYSDMDKGVVSFELDAKGRKRIDTAELQRVYGTLDIPLLENPNEQNGKHDLTTLDTSAPIKTDDSEMVTLLKFHIERLETELSIAHEREQHLMDMLKEQQKTQQLMLPAPKGHKRTWKNPFRLT